MKKPPFVRSPYNYDVEEASNAATIPAEEQGESLTVQAMSDDADINTIVRRFGITGKMPDNLRIPQYGDFSHITDYRSALDAVASAAEEFMRIPGEVRARFDNDPQMFLEFCSDERNREQMRQMGLLKDSLASQGAPGAAISGGAATSVPPPHAKPSGGSPGEPAPSST